MSTTTVKPATASAVSRIVGTQNLFQRSIASVTNRTTGFVVTEPRMGEVTVYLAFNSHDSHRLGTEGRRAKSASLARYVGRMLEAKGYTVVEQDSATDGPYLTVTR
jgi:hypothetical protein